MGKESIRKLPNVWLFILAPNSVSVLTLGSDSVLIVFVTLAPDCVMVSGYFLQLIV